MTAADPRLNAGDYLPGVAGEGPVPLPQRVLDHVWADGKTTRQAMADAKAAPAADAFDSASHRSSSQAGLASLYTSGSAVTDQTPALPEAPTPDHGPLAASLSDRTLAKVLSRPAHVPSIVMLDRDAAAQHLADEVEGLLSRFSEGLEIFLPVRQALADYRETIR